MKNFLVTLSFLFCSAAFAIPTTPVTVGGEEDMDACAGWGITLVNTTLFTVDANGVVNFEVIPASQGVAFCDSHSDLDGEFTGVIFSEDGNTDCEVSSPIPVRAPYAGKCKSGWVKNEFLMLIAG